ncbi:MAG: hypothetical protein Q8P73_03475 [bacterium]|nr:hypothetical protein [bacterium]
MPFFDGSGPRWGGGHRAGWGLGPCGNGIRRGIGGRLGLFWPWSQPSNRDDLSAYRKSLEEELARIKEEESRLNKS